MWKNIQIPIRLIYSYVIKGTLLQIRWFRALKIAFKILLTKHGTKFTTFNFMSYKSADNRNMFGYLQVRTVYTIARFSTKICEIKCPLAVVPLSSTELPVSQCRCLHSATLPGGFLPTGETRAPRQVGDGEGWFMEWGINVQTSLFTPYQL
jgi:hypothetical protein